MTPQQRDLARHALGLSSTCTRAYRNSFVTGPGTDDHAEWLKMVGAGEAVRRDGSTLPFGGDDKFSLTFDGGQKAVGPGDSILGIALPQSPPKEPVKA